MRIVLFAALRELAGASRLDLQVDPPDVRALIDQLGATYGSRFVAIVSAGSVIVNGEPASLDRPLGPADEVALLPPVSGG